MINKLDNWKQHVLSTRSISINLDMMLVMLRHKIQMCIITSMWSTRLWKSHLSREKL